MLKYFILDDEMQAREMLRYQMNRIQDTVCVGEAANVEEALALIAHTEIDLLFLDIEIHGSETYGYDVAQQLVDSGLNYGIVYVSAKLKEKIFYYEQIVQTAGQYLYFNILPKSFLFPDLEKVIAEYRKVRADYEDEKQKAIQDFLENMDKLIVMDAFKHSYNGITYIIPYHEILCAFVFERLLTIISVHENISLGNLQLVKLIEKMEIAAFSFLKIGRNHLINPKAVRRIDTHKGTVSLYLGGKSHEIRLDSSEIERMRKDL